MRQSHWMRAAGAAGLLTGVWLLWASTLAPGRWGLAALGGVAVAAGVAARLWRPAVVARCDRCQMIGEYSSVHTAEALDFALVEEISNGPSEVEVDGLTHVGTCIVCASLSEDAAREVERRRTRVEAMRRRRAGRGGGS